ncbi:hypothetical protein DER44DRAFT_740918 [Fusarium oxysporum]|nr:hypothetical protein DER44DRAFT_740918 [Fusarium oxysporum]
MKLSESITIVIAVPVAVICILTLAFIIKCLRKHHQAKESDPESGRALQGIPDTPAHAVPLQRPYRNIIGILGGDQIASSYLKEKRITKQSHRTSYRTSWGVYYKIIVDPKPDDDRIRAVIIPPGVDKSEHDKLKHGWPTWKVYTDNCEGGSAMGLPEDIMATLYLET